MLNSRKWRFAMMLGGTLVMSAVTSFAQTTCTVSYNNKALRKEGTAEALGDLTISGAAGVCDIPASGSTIVVTLSAPVVNTSSGSNQIKAELYASGVLIPNSTGVVSGGNTLTFGPTVGAGTINNLSVRGIRVNANQISGQVTVTSVQVTNAGNIFNLSPSSGPLGTVADSASLAVSSIGGSDATQTTAATILATCNATNDKKVVGFLKVTEAGAAVLRTQANEGSGALNGTQVAASLTIPEGVTIYLPSGAITTGSNTLTYVEGLGDSDATGLTTTYTPGGTDVAYAGAYREATSGTAVIYNVTTDSLATKDTLYIPIIVSYTAESAQGPVSGMVGFAPSTGAPSFIAPDASVTALTVGACTTSLLFPYVVNVNGWDTGLVISNTGSEGGDSGTCTVSFYGRGEVSEPVTSPELAPGGIFAWSLTYGGDGTAPVAPGFQGHAIAQCNFRLAHGYGFISSTTTPTNTGYLALVLNRNAEGNETLGH